jgi:hypothetical protein
MHQAGERTAEKIRGLHAVHGYERFMIAPVVQSIRDETYAFPSLETPVRSKARMDEISTERVALSVLYIEELWGRMQSWRAAHADGLAAKITTNDEQAIDDIFVILSR